MGSMLCALLIRFPSPFSSEYSHKGFCEQTKVSLPRVMHVVLDEQTISGRHVAIIGDVHGCLDELRDLIGQLETVTEGNCLFIFCGDVVNKGPINKETLDYVRAMGDNAMVIRGNHEDAALIHHAEWLASGKTEVKANYEWVSSLSNDDVTYLRELPYTISIPHLDAIVVHAGLNPWVPLWKQTPLHMTKMRNISGLDVAEELDINEAGHGYPWASLWPGPTHVYFGHDAKRRLQLYPYATGLDTGCLYGGQLTAKLLTGDQRLVQIEAKKVHLKPGIAGHGYPWAFLWPGTTHVYFGHDAERRLQLYPYATGLDTVCLYGGQLTAKVLTGDRRLVRFKARKVHLKPGMGRKRVVV